MDNEINHEILKEEDGGNGGRIRAKLIATMHENMDDGAVERQFRMFEAAQNRDTNRLWDLIIVAVGAAFISTFKFKDAA